MHEHYTDQLRIAELARRIHMSPSAFHLHFKPATSTSLLRYQKQIRLDS
jgi:AraC-like DNA-binding protein